MTTVADGGHPANLSNGNGGLATDTALATAGGGGLAVNASLGQVLGVAVDSSGTSILSTPMTFSEWSRPTA